MLRLQKINKSYNDKAVLKDFSAELPSCGIVLLRGDSGSGKTTLLRIISGIERADSGVVSGIENKKLTYVFQEDRLFPWLNVLDNAAITCNDRNRARTELNLLGLENSLGLFPNELSGGMKRRVSLARGFARGGDVFLFDEPETGLDAELSRVVFERITDISSKSLCILATHFAKWLEKSAICAAIDVKKQK